MKLSKNFTILFSVSLLFLMSNLVNAQGLVESHGLSDAQDLAEAQVIRPSIFFSTEVDFVSRTETGALTVISDGDLLHSSGNIYMRNNELLKKFDVKYDLGLDAVDVISRRLNLVAFSTELDSPWGNFTAGDLLTTWGTVIPIAALLSAFDIPHHLNLGLDAVQFIGKEENIIHFIKVINEIDPDDLVNNPSLLREFLKKYDVDIWFSTEGTAPTPQNPLFLDGDLLSAAHGIIIEPNSVLLPTSVPAGIIRRGVDFGLDAVTCYRNGYKKSILFSTEILFEREPDFTDGDVLRYANGSIYLNNFDLIWRFNPRANFLGLDALSNSYNIECQSK